MMMAALIFRDLQTVSVRGEETIGHVMRARGSGDAVEYLVVYWHQCRRAEGWFRPDELEAACSSTRH